MLQLSVIASVVPRGQGLKQLGELALAFGLSSLIGLEREWHQKSAGLRTHTLVGTGAALFVIVSKYGFSDVLGSQVVLDPSRVAAQVVTGIGFRLEPEVLAQGAAAVLAAEGALSQLTVRSHGLRRPCTGRPGCAPGRTEERRDCIEREHRDTGQDASRRPYDDRRLTSALRPPDCKFAVPSYRPRLSLCPIKGKYYQIG